MNAFCVFSTILLLLTLAPVAHGQGVITGLVTGNGAPLPGTNVRLQESTQGAATQSDGTYRITGVTPGTHILVVSAMGFETTQRAVTVDAGKTVRIDITLSEAVLRGEEVVVTGTMREQYVRDSPVKVEVMTSERLQRAQTTSNLMDVIGSVNGLTTQLNCGVCGTNAIRINGVEGPNTAVLIDGMPVMGALASVYGLNGISPAIIDQVEVIKGPQSTLYGTQALGGVVNIITKDPDNTPTFSGEVYGRSTAEGSVDLAVSPSAGRVNGFLSATAFQMENYVDDNGDGFADVPKRSRLGIFGKGTLENRSGVTVGNVAAKFYGENRTGGVRAYSDAQRGSGRTYGESIYTRRGEVMANYMPPSVDGLRVEGAFTYHDQDSYYGTEHYVAQQGISFAQVTYAMPMSDAVDLLAGSTVRYQTYNDNTPATSSGADRRVIPGVFGQMEARAGDLTFLAGLRVDHQKTHGFVRAPRLSAKYSPSDRTTIRAGTGTGFRIVNVFTEDHAALTGSRDVVFTEDLKPERSRSITTSIEHIFPLRANPLTVTVDGFYTRFSNKIIPDYDQDPSLIVYENLDGFSVTRGFSIGLDQNLTALPLTYNLGFTLTDVFTEENGTRRAVAYAPDYTGTAGVTYQIRSIGVELDYAARLVGPKRMPDVYVDTFRRDQTSPVHSTHDLKLEKAFGSVTSDAGLGIDVFVSVENVFDHTQGSPLVDAETPFSPDFDTIYTWGPIVGRTFALGARLNLR
ncbi:TonB-dependent receptor [Longibacter salinarum]|uniref:TonB-dependent receptor n=1 Tax=Longibacter salinarum TaxID=1850348 RepID=A0A2A8CV82_9BACT|nr:TonB-dependent receptor [Longibacter salinarum]PEN12507.1 TonB-dependent receptor [Longibacter salinarum]